jgi:hypothetical protein
LIILKKNIVERYYGKLERSMHESAQR